MKYLSLRTLHPSSFILHPFRPVLHPFRAVLLGIALGAASIPAYAAPVTFGKPTVVAGDQDVVTAGTLDRAINFGGAEQKVNGVTFSAGTTGGNTSSVDFGTTSLAAAGGALVHLQDVFAGEAAPFSTLSTAYKALLSSAAWVSTNKDTLTLTLSGLVQGKTYTAQFFANDSRDFHGGNRTQTIASGGATSDPLSYSTTGGTGGIGTWITATFTADGPTQAFVFTPVDPATDDTQLNAFQLRVGSK